LRLPKKDWTNPIKLPSSSSYTPFEAAYTRYSAKLYQLSQVWSRLEPAINAHEDYMELLKSTAMAGRQLTPQEAKENGNRFTRETRFIHLDLEDFHIHSRILMDRVTAVIGHFLPGTVQDKDDPSFSAHRNFLLKKQTTPYGPDEEYAAYVRNRTGWFQTMLRDYRDLFICT
jgi:hypothetical protein